ncbi:MAG: hypothetical protein ACRDNP_07255 [Gaiellaceae bacterium]
MNDAAPLPRWRRITVWVLIVLAGLIGLVSALTVWAKQQALETDKWVATSSRLLEDDEIRGALSLYLVDQLYENVDVAAELQTRLPPEVKPLAGPIAGGLRELSVRAADNLLSRPAVQTLWQEANRRAHEAFIRIVDDEGEFLLTGEGEVVLDLQPIVQQLADRIGLTEAEVEERLGPDAGRIVIMEADQLGTVQTAVELIRKLSVWLAIAILVLFALAVYLAQGRRRETLRAVGITFVVVGALLLVIRRLAGNWIVDALASGESIRDTASNAWYIGTDLLAGVAWTAIAYGVIVILAAWLAGPSRPAVSVRRRLAPGLRDRPGLVYAIVGLLYLLVVAWGPTPAFRQPWSILVFAALTGLGVEAFRRLTVREFPAGTPSVT